jgi:hypothetical protein
MRSEARMTPGGGRQGTAILQKPHRLDAANLADTESMRRYDAAASARGDLMRGLLPMASMIRPAVIVLLSASLR